MGSARSHCNNTWMDGMTGPSTFESRHLPPCNLIAYQLDPKLQFQAGANLNTPKIAEYKWMIFVKNAEIMRLAKYSVCKLMHIYSCGWKGIIPC